MWKAIRGYLTFTRKERFGVLFLFVLICILFVLPYFFTARAGDPDPEAYEKMKAEIRKFESTHPGLRQEPESAHPDSSRESQTFRHYAREARDEPDQTSTGKAQLVHPALFYFDPNRLSITDCLRLGLTERLSKTIMHYLEKGGRFRKADDLRKLYGLRPDDYERLVPFVRIRDPSEAFHHEISETRDNQKTVPAIRKTEPLYPITRVDSVNHPNRTFFTSVSKRLKATDINAADSAEWSRFPGIGQKLASRIVHFRERLGGFYKIDQVGETFGLPDSIFGKIKPVLQLNAMTLKQIDLNRATPEMLRAHPYIRWQMAKEITEFRLQHGRFHSVDDLLQIAEIEPAALGKVKPYLTVDP